MKSNEKPQAFTQDEWRAMDDKTFNREILKRSEYAKTCPKISLEEFEKWLFAPTRKIA